MSDNEGMLLEDINKHIDELRVTRKSFKEKFEELVNSGIPPDVVFFEGIKEIADNFGVHPESGWRLVWVREKDCIK